jgi:hypothetical protein
MMALRHWCTHQIAASRSTWDDWHIKQARVLLHLQSLSADKHKTRTNTQELQKQRTDTWHVKHVLDRE